MYETYLQSSQKDVEEFNRCSNSIGAMLKEIKSLDLIGQQSLLGQVERAFPRAPIAATPIKILTASAFNSLGNLKYITDVLRRPGTCITVPGLMSSFRISLLSSAHLCYVVSNKDPAKASERMAKLYELEAASARRFVGEMDSHPAAKHQLRGLVPSAGSSIRELSCFEASNGAVKSITETKLLNNLKNEVLPPFLKRLNLSPTSGMLLIDHLFNITSGAAHGFTWIDLDGVSANVVSQLSVSTMISNIVFNYFLKAAGQHPNS